MEEMPADDTSARNEPAVEIEIRGTTTKLHQGLRAERFIQLQISRFPKWGNTFQLFLSSYVCQLHWKGRIPIQRLQRISQLQTKTYESIQFRRADVQKGARSLYLSRLIH